MYYIIFNDFRKKINDKTRQDKKSKTSWYVCIESMYRKKRR